MNLLWQLKPTITHSNHRGGNQVWIRQTLVRKNSKNDIIRTLPCNKWSVVFFHNIKKRGYYV